MWIANKEGFSKPSQWNAFVFLLPLEHFCIVRSLWGCLMHSPYLTSAFGIHCGHQLLQAPGIYLEGADVPPRAPGSPCSAGSCSCTQALKKQERCKERGPFWLFYSKCWSGTAALSSLELHPSLSGHLPQPTSLSCLRFATKASHPKPWHTQQVLSSSMTSLLCIVF